MRVKPVKPEHAYFVGAIMPPTSSRPVESAEVTNMAPNFEDFLKMQGQGK
jgi:hypothetical protein